LDLGGELELTAHAFGPEGFCVEAGIDDGCGGLGGDGLCDGDVGVGKVSFVLVVQPQGAYAAVFVGQADGEVADEAFFVDVLAIASEALVSGHVVDDDDLAVEGAHVEAAFGGGDRSLVDVGVAEAVGGL